MLFNCLLTEGVGVITDDEDNSVESNRGHSSRWYVAAAVYSQTRPNLRVCRNTATASYLQSTGCCYNAG